MKKIVAAFLIIVASVFGCKTGDGVQQPPPTPLEAKILSQTVTSVAIAQEDLSKEQLEKLSGVFVGMKGSLLLAIGETPEAMDTVAADFLEGVDPVYQDVASGVMQILILRIRPYIDTGNPDLGLARDYVEAILDGAIAGVNRALTRLELTGSLRINRDDWLRAVFLDGLRT